MAQSLLQSSSTDVTIDVTPQGSHDSTPAPRPWAGFIEGSGPQITLETADLLRYRLRAAAGILLLAFGAFFLYRLVRGETFMRASNFSFYFHFAVLVVLASSWTLLCRTCSIPMAVLRGYELAIFGITAAYLLLYDYELLSYYATKGFLPSVVATWMGTTFTYSMFIPNTWRRAAVANALLCSPPIALAGYLYRTNDQFAAAVASNPLFTTEMVILLFVTFVAATYGTNMINSLRLEAFEAKQLGQYKLCKLIGKGGMGEVYLAEHQMMKRPCAIKLIRPGKAGDPQALARFEREVRATARLSHWNSIEIFDYGRTPDGTFYYVMEFLPGMSLAELVEKHGPLSPARALHLLTQTCDALAEAHGQGLIHRDLKPGNIFAAQRGGVYDVAKLLDFGLAKPIASPDNVQLTQDGAITGSPLYMSPEQALGDSEPDARSDIYSLGAVAYYLLSGAPPFEGEKPIKIILAHANETVTPLSRRRPEVPEDLERVVMKALAKRPQDRFEDVRSLRRALVDCSLYGAWSADDATSWWLTNGAKSVEPCIGMAHAV